MSDTLSITMEDGNPVEPHQNKFMLELTDLSYRDVALRRSDNENMLSRSSRIRRILLSGGEAFQSTNQEWYEHVGSEVTRSQDDKSRVGKTKNYTCVADRHSVQIHLHFKVKIKEQA
ncbi:hypothetical protein Tco_0774897 [Tanacetum coccineum]|uniref:Uncharacterized protein n=1 Tax=Tanacetum coccineum TaxID=301880 RepID=A0ABQ4ZS37_9ASTR